jgi:MYXO-CTERM domain-containing protein
MCQAIQKNGYGCNPGNWCYQNGSCQNGMCVPILPVSCPKPDQCHDPGICDPMTGFCRAGPNKGDGVGCYVDDNRCKIGKCQSGACVSVDSVPCQPPDDCHNPGTCDPATGKCSAGPNKADGTACKDATGCNVSECQSGKCVVSATKRDGERCNDGELCITGTCRAGNCEGTPVTCACPDATCGRHLCFGPSRACRTSCDSVNDCAPGYVCDRTHQCVDPPPNTHNLDESGCACTLAPADAPWPPAAFSLLTLGALFARRRSAHSWARGIAPGAAKGETGPRGSK